MKVILVFNSQIFVPVHLCWGNSFVKGVSLLFPELQKIFVKFKTCFAHNYDGYKNKIWIFQFTHYHMPWCSQFLNSLCQYVSVTCCRCIHTYMSSSSRFSSWDRCLVRLCLSGVPGKDGGWAPSPRSDRLWEAEWKLVWLSLCFRGSLKDAWNILIENMEQAWKTPDIF